MVVLVLMEDALLEKERVEVAALELKEKEMVGVAASELTVVMVS
jgi:hypothetical protein